MKLFSRFLSLFRRKKGVQVVDVNVYEVECEVLLGKRVLSKQKFTVRAINKNQAQRQIREMRLYPKRAKLYNALANTKSTNKAKLLDIIVSESGKSVFVHEAGTSNCLEHFEVRQYKSLEETFVAAQNFVLSKPNKK